MAKSCSANHDVFDNRPERNVVQDPLVIRIGDMSCVAEQKQAIRRRTEFEAVAVVRGRRRHCGMSDGRKVGSE